MGIITFNGISSNNVAVSVGGLRIAAAPGYEIPEKNYEIVNIQGRNGALVYDTGSYSNIERSYYITAGSYNSNFFQIAKEISAWLNSAKGYAPLKDSYTPGIVREAYYAGGVDINNIFDTAAGIEAKFVCKPQKFIETYYENEISISNNAHIDSPENVIDQAKPILKIVGNGGAATIRITYSDQTFSEMAFSSLTANQEIVVNCDIMDCYSGSVNKNNILTLSGNVYPVLKPGRNVFTMTNISTLEVIPRWFLI